MTAIYQDKAGTLWIGTQDGLDRFNPQTETFESETSVHGRLVGSIIEDQQGNLWLGTWTGLMRRRPGEANFNLIGWEVV